MQTEGDADRQIQTYRHTDIETGMQACRQAYMHKQICRHAGRQAYRHTETNRQMEM